MSATEAPTIVTRVDLASVSTGYVDAAVALYGETLGFRRSVDMPECHLAESEAGGSR